MPSQAQFTALKLAAAAAETTSTNGTATDLKGYINPGGRNMKAILNMIEMGGTTAITVKLQDNTTSITTGFTDISGGAFTACTTSGTHEEIHCRTNKRYVRAVSTFAGVSTAYYGVELIVEKRNA